MIKFKSERAAAIYELLDIARSGSEDVADVVVRIYEAGWRKQSAPAVQREPVAWQLRTQDERLLQSAANSLRGCALELMLSHTLENGEWPDGEETAKEHHDHMMTLAKGLEELKAARTEAVQGEPEQPPLQLPDFATDPDDSDEVASLWDHGFKRGWNSCLGAVAKAMQPAEQQPCPEGVREGAPYDDPAFESLCREYGIWGTAAAAQCAVFWEGGKRADEQQPAPDVAGLVEALRMLVAAGSRLNDDAEECTHDDGMAEVASADFWGDFREALEAADAALAAYRKGGEA